MATRNIICQPHCATRAPCRTEPPSEQPCLTDRRASPPRRCAAASSPRRRAGTPLPAIRSTIGILDWRASLPQPASTPRSPGAAQWGHGVGTRLAHPLGLGSKPIVGLSTPTPRENIFNPPPWKARKIAGSIREFFIPHLHSALQRARQSNASTQPPPYSRLDHQLFLFVTPHMPAMSNMNQATVEWPRHLDKASVSENSDLLFCRC